MIDYFKEAEEKRVARQKQDALDEEIRLRKVAESQAALNNAIEAIKNLGTQRNDDEPAMAEQAAKYSKILDGLFDYYLDKAKDGQEHDRAIGLALKTHQQAIRSLYVWHKLKS